MPPNGKLIALEGPDGALLDTQVERLYRWLREKGIRVEQTQAPTRGPIGALLRLEQQGRLHFDPTSLALLWTADRMDHLGRKGGILSWLHEGHLVLCARYLLYAMAMLADQVDLDWLRQINAHCYAPDLTLFIAPPASPADPLQEQYERVLDTSENLVRIQDCASADQVEQVCRGHIAALLGQEVGS
jgi:dTMP kinase